MSVGRDTHRKLDELQKRFKIVEKRLDALEHSQIMPDPTVVLRTRQDTILQRISSLEACKNQLIGQGVRNFSFKTVPNDYYQKDLEFRRACLKAASIQHLCKSLVYENPKLPVEYNSPGKQDFRFFLVIVQYTAKLHGEKVKRFLHKANGKLGVQYFRPRQAHFETSEKLSGYASGCVTPVGLRTPLPVILSHEIANLQPDFFWMGGGENLLKLGMSIADFIDAYNPVIVDCTY